MKKTTQKINSIALVIVSLMLTLGFVPMTWASEINAENVIRYVNEARSKEGLLELATSEKLTEVAKAKVNDMVTNHYFAHTSPAGLTPWHWFETVGYDYRYAGENLAINFITAESEQAAWMNSPTHRKNIMNVNYQEIGVAVAAGEVNGTLGIIAVQEFGTLTHPGAGSDKKDFAPVKDKALPDTTKFVPTVLSTGDQKAGESLDKLGEKITAPS
ncbi:MAG: CAP domain-containing protein, partial [Candidatus Moraniibacteriota bacterium]